MEVTSLIPKEASLYGVGEFTPSNGFRLHRDGRAIALWNQDLQAHTPDANLYGSRPFLMSVLPGGTQKEKSNEGHIICMRLCATALSIALNVISWSMQMGHGDVTYMCLWIAAVSRLQR